MSDEIKTIIIVAVFCLAMVGAAGYWVWFLWDQRKSVRDMLSDWCDWLKKQRKP